MLALQPDAPPRRDAEEIALAALAFIAWRADEISDFLFATGLERSTIREAAATPQFLAGVLDYVVEDTRTLRRVATGIRSTPEEIDQARRQLLPAASVTASADPHAFGPGPLVMECEHCRKVRRLDRRSWYRVPARVATIRVPRCGACGGGFDQVETWLDAEGNKTYSGTSGE